MCRTDAVSVTRLLSEVSGKLLIPRERQQTMRVTESKCLRRRLKGVRSARKGIGGPLPGVENRSSEERVSDGRLKPDSEDSLHYSLLLGGGDTNDSGKGDEGFNTPVCRSREINLRGIIAGQDRACAKTGISRPVGLLAKDTGLSRRRDGFDSHTG